METPQPWIDALLRRGGGFALERIRNEAFDDDLLQSLYGMSNELMAEPLDHFCRHARTNDMLHVFRKAGSDRIEGFQFWRAGVAPGKYDRYILGGKLRIRPESRRRALHLLSGLSVLADEQAEHPQAKIVRLSIASIFGMTSIAKRLANYAFIDRHGQWADLVGLVDRLMRESRYELDPETARVHVGIYVTEEQIQGYPEAFFRSAPARAYIERNPDYRTNGSYLAFAFSVDRVNVEALARGAAQIVLGEAPPDEEGLGEFLSLWRARGTSDENAANRTDP